MKMVISCILLSVLIGCSGGKKPDTSINQPKETIIFDSLTDTSGDSLMVYFKNDSVFFRHKNAHKVILSIPWKKEGNYPSENLKGIYIFDNNTLIKYTTIENEDKVIFTVFDELYRGQLYCVRFKDKTIYKDSQFNRDYLIGQSGIFLFDKVRGRILSVENPYLDEKTDEMITPITIYLLDDLSFQFLGTVKCSGELIYSDSLIIQFYTKYQKVNGHWSLIKE